MRQILLTAGINLDIINFPDVRLIPRTRERDVGAVADGFGSRIEIATNVNGIHELSVQRPGHGIAIIGKVKSVTSPQWINSLVRGVMSCCEYKAGTSDILPFPYEFFE